MSKYAVMLFESELDLGISYNPDAYVNTSNYITENGQEALIYYADTPCPASQIITAKDEYELQCKMGEMIINYRDKDWLNQNLYPYL